MNEIILYDEMDNEKKRIKNNIFEKLDFVPKVIKLSPLITVKINKTIILNNPYDNQYVYVRLNVVNIESIEIMNYVLSSDHLNDSKSRYVCYILLFYFIFYLIVFFVAKQCKTKLFL